MKKPKIKSTCNISILVMGVLFFSMISCREDVLNDQTQNSNQFAQNLSGEKQNQSARLGKGICFPVVDPGRIVRRTLVLRCDDTWGECNRYYTECLPWLDPCALIPCGIEWRDPWIIYDKFRETPEVFDSFRDAGQIKIDPSTTRAYFPVNGSVLGMQFYQEWEHSLSKDKLHLRTALLLDEETANDYGLEGDVLPAGIYPVIYNEKNNTFNAFAAVSKFPVEYDRPINQIIPAYFDGTLNSLLKDFYIKEQPESVLIETDLEKYTVEPNISKNIAGVYAASSNLYDLSLIFKGDPNPQSSKYGTPTKILVEGEIWLNEEIAKLLNIEPFLIRPENVHQAYDEKEDVLRVTILR
ncbi:hypothetical protein JMN32_10975 [Fulvivirga sp. 29W222]|uniref:Uncharacterized protein n=1 Tax=Fulvivirga marina TaxID=2494733 RepID=A0A937KBX0_9BACT|nr:hypothetical protein [Fulvivirga marina]MBL6446837.1 hypothetical protein [Fulvivirga marina]